MKNIKTLLMAAGLMCISSLSHASSVTPGGSTGALGSIFLDGGGPIIFGSATPNGFYDLRAAFDLDFNLSILLSPGAAGVKLYRDSDSIFSMIGTFSAEEDPLLASGTNGLMASLLGGSGEVGGPLYFLQFISEAGYTVGITTPSAVPVPAAGILFASALFGVGALGRRKKKNVTTSVNGDFSHTS